CRILLPLPSGKELLATQFMKKRISIITPVYNEAENLDIFDARIHDVLLTHTNYAWEVVFVEDGSRDESWEKLTELCRKEERYRAIRLSRNYGSHAALFAGFRACTGSAAVFVACDLQDPPETVLEFLKYWESGSQIVF